MRYILSHKFPILLVILLTLLSISSVSTGLITKSENQEKSPSVKKTNSTVKTSSTPETINDGENSVKVNVDDKISANQNSADTNSSNTSTQNGTCTVTKNGVTTVVPADQVKIDEHVSGDVTVKVNCENKINQSNSSSTSVNNKIDVKVNSTP
ncbi:MAG TPA: hypothetical protein VLE47_03430, partial [Candidatus Saccharimonadales bacterium]|nr:hypothetical protein [Candidatus Saccharimonadales bacterium]